MITVNDIFKLSELDKEAIAREEAKIDKQLLEKDFSGGCITVDAPTGLNTKSRDALKKTYERGGWTVREDSWRNESYWHFYTSPPAEYHYSK